MIGPSPEVTNSQYFRSEPEWHMLPGASDKDRPAGADDPDRADPDPGGGSLRDLRGRLRKRRSIS